MPKRLASLAALAALAALGALGAFGPAAEAQTIRQDAWSFPSAPGLDPAAVSVPVDKSAASQSPGYIFVSPMVNFASRASFVGVPGPEILEANGSLVWQEPLRKQRQIRGVTGRLSAADFHPATYEGQPVLVWWQGILTPEATTGGEWVLANQHYQTIATVHAPPGFGVDLHEIALVAPDDAYIIASRVVSMNLKGCCKGPAHGRVYDQVVLEIEVKTGKVLWEWDPLKHVPLRESYEPIPKSQPWNPYHLNSIAFGPSGNAIISSRNTWAAYWVNRTSPQDNGRVLATLGGKRSTFSLGPGVRFAWQHDVREQEGDEVTLFDDEAAPPEGKQSRGLVLKLDWAHHTAALVHQYLLPEPRLAGSQGNLQVEPGGNVFVGWGQLPYFSEYTASGELLYEGALPGSDESYRAFRAPWIGLPNGRPGVSATVVPGQQPVVYASWNGATQVVSWQLLAGPSPASLSPVGPPVPRSGFETVLRPGTSGAYYAVQALDASGRVLATSLSTTARTLPAQRWLTGSAAGGASG